MENKIEEQKISKDVKEEIIEDIEKGGVPEKQAEAEEKIAEKVEEEKKDVKKEPIKKKREEAVVHGYDLPMSTKTSGAICRFIKGKTIGSAIRDLELVVLMKKPVPMRGEIPHRKGKGIAGGRYPQKAAKNFIVLLKSLAGNASDIDEPIIAEAFANLASRPYGKFGRVRKKRTHIKIVAKEKKILDKNLKKKKGNTKHGRKKNS
jgi:ribosomal protein L22